MWCYPLWCPAAPVLSVRPLPPLSAPTVPRARARNCSDLDHLLQGLGGRGLSKLFNQLAILAWAVVAAKLLSLAAPWQEGSPLFAYLNEVVGHRVGDLLLEAEQLLVRLLP